MNYIQYLTESQNVKTLEVFNNDNNFRVNTINEPFFITALFVDDKRVNGVSFANKNNTDMLSVINDLNLVDVDLINFSNYFNASDDVILHHVPEQNAVESPSASVGGSVEISNIPHVIVDNALLNVKVSNPVTSVSVSNMPSVQNVVNTKDVIIAVGKNSTYLNTRLCDLPNDVRNMYLTAYGLGLVTGGSNKITLVGGLSSYNSSQSYALCLVRADQDVSYKDTYFGTWRILPKYTWMVCQGIKFTYSADNTSWEGWAVTG